MTGKSGMSGRSGTIKCKSNVEKLDRITMPISKSVRLEEDNDIYNPNAESNPISEVKGNSEHIYETDKIFHKEMEKLFKKSLKKITFHFGCFSVNEKKVTDAI